jgi:hypothetical protein
MQLRFGQLCPMRLLKFSAVEPSVRERRLFGRASATPLALSVLTGVRLIPVELPEQVIHHRKRLHRGKAGPQFAADRVSLEIPGNMLADVAARTILVAVEKLDEQLGMPPEGCCDFPERWLDVYGP